MQKDGLLYCYLSLLTHSNTNITLGIEKTKSITCQISQLTCMEPSEKLSITLLTSPSIMDWLCIPCNYDIHSPPHCKSLCCCCGTCITVLSVPHPSLQTHPSAISGWYHFEMTSNQTLVGTEFRIRSSIRIC